MGWHPRLWQGERHKEAALQRPSPRARSFYCRSRARCCAARLDAQALPVQAGQACAAHAALCPHCAAPAAGHRLHALQRSHPAGGQL